MNRLESIEGKALPFAGVNPGAVLANVLATSGMEGLSLMAQTPAGAAKVAAEKTGLSVEAYLKKIESGQKWCYLCRDWHALDWFCSDSSRYDSYASSCNDARNARGRAKYKPVPDDQRKRHGPEPIPARSGDKIQARCRVNRLVRRGVLPRPNSLPCTDCGHTQQAGDYIRHEYDHYLGYAADHHTDVQAVCYPCHHKRSVERGERRGKKH